MALNAFNVACVFPTHVGVFLGVKRPLLKSIGLPHARGGVSYRQQLKPVGFGVFPTHVGVFPYPVMIAHLFNRVNTFYATF